MDRMTWMCLLLHMKSQGERDAADACGVARRGSVWKNSSRCKSGVEKFVKVALGFDIVYKAIIALVGRIRRTAEVKIYNLPEIAICRSSKKHQRVFKC